MAYAVTNPPRAVSRGIGASGTVWLYQSTDVHTDVDAAGYFTNAGALSMKVGDIVYVVETDNSYAQTTHVVTEISAAGAGTISAAT